MAISTSLTVAAILVNFVEPLLIELRRGRSLGRGISMPRQLRMEQGRFFLSGRITILGFWNRGRLREKKPLLDEGLKDMVA